MTKEYIALLRPHQYVKNLFIFIPVFFGLSIREVDLLLKSSIAFAAFSLIASAVYILNDLMDIELDAGHPENRKRPLASGSVSKSIALILMGILILFGLVIAILINKGVFSLVLLYFLINIAYSVKLKQIAIVDIFIISSGFIIRVFVGAEATGIHVSMWTLLMTFLLALFLALAKRRSDILIQVEEGERAFLNGYSLEFINNSMVVMASALLVSYIMYTISPEVIKRINGDYLYLTVIWVVMGILRYMQITFVDRITGSPTDVLIRDRFLQMIILSWIITFWIIIYR